MRKNRAILLQNTVDDPYVSRKPIRPTEVNFANRVVEQQFYDYVHKTSKTESVGMNKIREMIENHKEVKR